MSEPHLPYPLDLGDGREPIMCRDAHQARLLLGLWRAWNADNSEKQHAGLSARTPQADLIEHILHD